MELVDFRTAIARAVRYGRTDEARELRAEYCTRKLEHLMLQELKAAPPLSLEQLERLASVIDLAAYRQGDAEGAA